MIKITIQFKCTWTKAKVQKLFDSLINADGITELGTSMISTQDEQTPTGEPEPAEVHTPKPLHIKTESLEQAESDPVTFTEIERIHDADLGQEHHTSKPILTYAKTEDGRVAIYYYKDTAVYTTMDTVRALPDKIPANMIPNLHSGKRAALRGFKKFLTGLDASENETFDDNKQATKTFPSAGFNPYAPILTGGAKVDTHSDGKIGGYE